MELSAAQYRKVEELADTMLSKSCETLANIMSTSLQLTSQELNFLPAKILQNVNFTIEDASSVYKTELNGDIKGVCFWILGEDEVLALTDQHLPKGASSNPEMAKEIRASILMEFDNILSAAAITVLSNKMNLSVMGGVPNKVDFKKDIRATIQPEITFDLQLIEFGAIFKTQNGNEFSFIWYLEDKFINKVIEVSN